MTMSEEERKDYFSVYSSSICKPDPGIDSEAIIKEDRGE